jgi:hydrogenase nickel incorporation protein HypA/HybF
MHELAVTESVLEIATRHARQAGAVRVTDIHIVIGRLSSIVDDSVQFYWDFVTENTICAGSKLHFERKPARLVCMDCKKEFSLEDDLIPCPYCSSPYTRVIAGEEFYLDAIEVEGEQETAK